MSKTVYKNLKNKLDELYKNNYHNWIQITIMETNSFVQTNSKSGNQLGSLAIFPQTILIEVARPGQNEFLSH